MADAASAPLSCDLNAAGLTPEATAYVVHIAFALLLVRTACTAHRAIGTATSLAFLAFAFAVISGKGVFPYVLVKA